jgi:hypothetical protein
MDNFEREDRVTRGGAVRKEGRVVVVVAELREAGGANALTLLHEDSERTAAISAKERPLRSMVAGQVVSLLVFETTRECETVMICQKCRGGF